MQISPNLSICRQPTSSARSFAENAITNAHHASVTSAHRHAARMILYFTEPPCGHSRVGVRLRALSHQRPGPPRGFEMSEIERLKAAINDLRKQVEALEALLDSQRNAPA